MGIPNFYSWLLQKYPQIKIPCKQDDHSNGIEVCVRIFNDDPIFIFDTFVSVTIFISI